jgi:hypothetical protein
MPQVKLGERIWPLILCNATNRMFAYIRSGSQRL